MLEIRPNCELCDKDLPPQSLDAHICSYECTYCTDCVKNCKTSARRAVAVSRRVPFDPADPGGRN